MQIIYDLKNEIGEEILTSDRILFIKDLINEKFPISLRKQQRIYEKICKEIIDEISIGHIESAFNFLKLIYLSENYKLGHNYVKSTGIFRSSKYHYNFQPLLELINNLNLFLSTISINLYSNYFNSIKNLLILSDDIKNEYEKIVQFLMDDQALRIVLNNCDHTFMVNTLHPELFQFSNSVEEMIIKSNFYSPEEISNSISNIVSIYIESHVKEIIPTANLNSTPDYNLNILEIIASSFKINKYKEIEIDVGVFEYQATLINNQIKIQGDTFERQKRVGYFLSEQKRLSLAIETLLDLEKDDKDYLKFEDLLEDLTKLSSGGELELYRVATNPDRFLLNPPLDIFQTKKYSSNIYHLEDLIRFSQIYYENYLFNKVNSIDEIANTNIHSKFTVMDYINLSKIFRLFNYSLIIAYTENRDKIKNIEQLFSNSLLSIISKDHIKLLFNYIIKIQNDEELEDFLSPISLNINEKNNYIDLQYTPILKINDFEYLTLNATSFNSDIIRKICIHNKFSFSIDNSNDVIIDQMVVEIKNCFIAKDFLVQTDFNFSKFELDLIALKDNSLFIFECKNPYHPVNSHELRNVYDHIEHAIFQLERAKNELEDNSKLSQLFENLGWSEHYNSNIKVYYGICNANRMLVGYNKNEIYVHHAHQLINLLTTGEIINFDHTESLWESNEFNTNDLIRFITGESISQNYDELTEKYHFNFKTSDFEISIESYLSGMNYLRKSHTIDKNITVKLEDHL